MAEEKQKKKFSEMESRFLTDYYKTNREITKDDRKRWKEERAARKAEGGSAKDPWTDREKIMVAACVVLAILCILRYVVFKV